ncbi:MAG: Hsp70 family protein [Planctomycetota bacterium]|nr:MAG: Hsp70 family protein [Planctomycetota bacterium]
MTPSGGSEQEDPFAGDDPLDAAGGSGDSPAAVEQPTAGEEASDDFDALGFDTGFGMDPGGLGDEDDTPPGGIYIGEDVSVLDAASIGRALAEADGTTEDYSLPDMGELAEGLVGIDLGAAVAVVAVFNKDGKHEIVPNADDDLNTPVQLFFDDDGERLVGREAREMAPSAPQRAVLDLKAAITDEGFRLEAGEEHGGALAAEDVVTVLIERLLADVREHTGEAPTHVALAAPLWFEERHREVLRRAVERVGATLVGITDEALAAAVPYSLRLPDLNERRALVFDLGHAALSVAVVRCAAGDIEVLAQASEQELGSHAWDELLAREAARKFEQKYGLNPLEDPAAAFDLRLRAEDAKKALSQRAQVTLVASCQGKTLKVGFSRQGFEEAARPLLEGARALMERVRDEAGVGSWEELDAVIMAGGGSRTPAVRRMLAKTTGKTIERGISPEDGVAVGSLYWGAGERHRQSRPDV